MYFKQEKYPLACKMYKTMENYIGNDVGEFDFYCIIFEKEWNTEHSDVITIESLFYFVFL